jgi:hypothetical protein
MSALTELEKPVTPAQPTHAVFQSHTDLKLAQLEANLREIEIHQSSSKQLQNGVDNFDLVNAKAEETQKMMSRIFNEKEFEKEQSNKQVEILHSAIRQQRGQTKKNLEGEFFFI